MTNLRYGWVGAMALALGATTGCGGGGNTDAGGQDTMQMSDTGHGGDTGPTDTGVDATMDGAPNDTGMGSETTVTDTGSEAAPNDTGPSDTGPIDTGPADTGPMDGGFQDTGPADTGPVDTGPVDGGPTGSIQVAVGVGHLCVVNTHGNLYCWGTNTTGQLGQGYVEGMNDSNGCTNNRYPELVQGITNPLQIVVGGGSIVGSGITCALLSDHTVDCWGDNSAHTLGQDGLTLPPSSTGPSGPGSATPVAVPGLANVSQIALSPSSGHACAVVENSDSTQSVYCWGNNLNAECGQAPASTGSTDVFPPAVVGGMDHVQVTQISLGDSNSCAVMGDGTVKCWGLAGEGPDMNGLYTGELGVDPSTIQTMCPDGMGGMVECFTTATTIPGLTNATYVQLGVREVCTLTTAGTIACVGDDTGVGYMVALGEDLTNGPVTHYGTAAVLPAPLTNVSTFHGWQNTGHTWGCAQSGTDWYCWGQNDVGVLLYDPGNVNSVPSTTQMQILTANSIAQNVDTTTLPTIANMYVGSTMCVVGTDVSLWCWGSSTEGQVILGGTGSTNSPYNITAEDLGVCSTYALTL